MDKLRGEPKPSHCIHLLTALCRLFVEFVKILLALQIRRLDTDLRHDHLDLFTVLGGVGNRLHKQDRFRHIALELFTVLSALLYH